MRRLLVSTAILAAAAALGACHNPKSAKSDAASTPVGTAQIASNDVPNCKPVACTPAGGIGGPGSTHGGSGAAASGTNGPTGAGSAASAGGSASKASGSQFGAWRGYHRVHETGAHRHWWNWGWGAHAGRANVAARPAQRQANAGWRRTQAGAQGWSRQDQWNNDRDRELNLAQLHHRWTRRDQYASGYGADRRWPDDRSTSRGREAHYGYLDEPLDRGAYDERYIRQHSMQGSSYARSSSYTRYYGEHRVIAPARTCAPGAWLSADGHCVFAQHRVGQEVSVPGSFFYDNGGVGSDVSGGGGGGGGFIYGGGNGGGYGRSSASAFASAHAYATAHASVHIRGGSHGGHGGHGGGCGCGGKH